jgi:hypothetical protein
MSNGRARDILYGRRGGGWVDEPRRPALPRPTPAPPAPQPSTGEPATLFAPPGADDHDDHQADDATALAATAPAAPAAVPVVLDPDLLFAPETIAARRAHTQQCRAGHGADGTCPAVIDPDDLAAVWAGAARMARVRLAAGAELTDVDRAALARAESHDQGVGR